MKFKSKSSLWTQSSLVVIGIFICSLFLVSSNGQTRTAKQVDKAAIRQRIAAIVGNRVKEGVFGSNSNTTYTRVPPSSEAVKEIKGYGDNALPALIDYLQSNNERERSIAVEFIGLLGGRRIVTPLQRVIQRDSAPYIRILALRWITQAPPAMTLPIIRKAAQTDSDERVRQTAKDILDAKSSKPADSKSSQPFRKETNN
jgi:hypothetical protein